LPAFVFLGFCAKHIVTVPLAGRTLDIASVSECISKRPDHWVKRWDWNRATCWNTEAEAWASVPEQSRDEYRVFAYRALPMRFDNAGVDTPLTLNELFSRDLPDLPAEPAALPYHSIGYDIVERNPAMGMLGFGCSPLSCNGMADSISVNEFCLIDNLETALGAAQRFGVEQPEPGPYVVIEVLAPHS